MKKRRCPKLLREYRIVSRSKAPVDGEEETPFRQSLRQLLKDSPRSFMAEMNKLEVAFAAVKAAEAGKADEPEPDAVVDEGTEMALEHAKRFLENLHAESR